MEVFGPRNDEIREQFRILGNEELPDVCRSASVVRIVKCRRLRWAGNMTGIRETGNGSAEFW